VQTTVDLNAVKAAQLDVQIATAALTDATQKHGEGSLEAQKAQVALTQAEGKLQEAISGEQIELTDAQKVQARYALMVGASKNVTGDFARTSDGAANKMRIAQASAGDLSAKFGDKLIPVGLRLIDMGQGLIDKFDGLSEEQQTATIIGLGFLAMLGPTVSTIGTLITVAGSITKATWLWNAAQTALNFVMNMNPIGLVVIAIGALVAAFVIAYNTSEDFRRIVDTAFTGVRDAAKVAVNAVIGFINAIITAWNGLEFRIPGIRVENPIPGQPPLVDWGGVTIGTPDLPTIPLLAQGVRNWRGGLAVVGEHGPELVNLPRGADVYSNRESRRMGDTYNVTINSPAPVSTWEADISMARALAGA
jgi:uncharacterized Tic20 family protein